MIRRVVFLLKGGFSMLNCSFHPTKGIFFLCGVRFCVPKRCMQGLYIVVFGRLGPPAH